MIKELFIYIHDVEKVKISLNLKLRFGIPLTNKDLDFGYHIDLYDIPTAQLPEKLTGTAISLYNSCNSQRHSLPKNMNVSYILTNDSNIDLLKNKYPEYKDKIMTYTRWAMFYKNVDKL